MKVTPPKSGIERLVDAIGSVPSLVIHTLWFAASFGAVALGLIKFETMLLVLTTIVSLEAIYLALFIQITVNRNTEQLREVEEDIDEISEDMDEIQEDLDEISEDIDEIQEDVEELSEEGEGDAVRKPKKPRAEKPEKTDTEILENLTKDLNRLLRDLEELKNKK